MVRINETIQKGVVLVDTICDYTMLSPVTNAVGLIGKELFKCKCFACCIEAEIIASHIKSKDSKRSCVLLIPVFGSLGVATYEFICWLSKKKQLPEILQDNEAGNSVPSELLKNQNGETPENQEEFLEEQEQLKEIKPIEVVVEKEKTGQEWFDLGFLHQVGGKDVAVDLAQAVKCHEKAVELGHIEALVVLGAIYSTRNSYDFPIDLDKAEKYYTDAKDLGLAGLFRLGEIYRGNGRFDGFYEIEVNLTKAASCYKKVAEAGDPQAMHLLGNVYHNQNGRDQSFTDLKKAVEWYKKAIAADENDAISMCCLGHVYSKGSEDVPIDLNEAIKWYAQSADKGVVNGYYWVGRIYYEGDRTEKTNFQIDLHKAEEWFLKGAAKDNSSCHYYLGLLYKDGGKDFPVDLVKADYHMQQAEKLRK